MSELYSLLSGCNNGTLTLIIRYDVYAASRVTHSNLRLKLGHTENILIPSSNITVLVRHFSLIKKISIICGCRPTTIQFDLLILWQYKLQFSDHVHNCSLSA